MHRSGSEDLQCVLWPEQSERWFGVRLSPWPCAPRCWSAAPVSGAETTGLLSVAKVGREAAGWWEQEAGSGSRKKK